MKASERKARAQALLDTMDWARAQLRTLGGICERCGAGFVPTREGRRYCGPACASRAASARFYRKRKL